MATSTSAQPQPNPGMIFDTLNAFQRSAALKAAIELDVFSEIAKGSSSANEIANAADASERGMRILCDYLVILGLLAKQGDRYSLTMDSAMFLDKASHAYLGGTARFILDPRMTSSFQDLAAIVRKGGTTLPDHGSVSYDNPVWVEFAEAMAPMMFPSAQEIAGIVGGGAGGGAMKVLDIAAGHGLFGIVLAQHNPQASITALDWPNVLAVASKNAMKFGVADRHFTLPGDAFTTEFGGPYDVILVTNFFHHFDPSTCEKLMAKILASLVPGGRCVTLEFVPNEDRVSPPIAAGFSLTMLGSTDSGEAYTFADYQKMFGTAGFASSELHASPQAPESVIVSRKS